VRKNLTEELSRNQRDLVILREVYFKFVDVESKIEKAIEISKEYYQRIRDGRDSYFDSNFDQELSFEEIYDELPSYIKEVDETISYEIESLRTFINDMKKYKERAERIISFMFRLEDKLTKGDYDISSLEYAGINIRFKGNAIELYYEFDGNVLYHELTREDSKKQIRELLDSIVNLNTLKYMLGSLMDAMNYCCIGKRKFSVVEELQNSLKEIYDMIP